MRCKVGDLVVVSGRVSRPHTDNRGRFGTVTEVMGTHYIGKGDWWVLPQNKFQCYVPGLRIVQETVDEVCFLDMELTPIRPGDLVEDTETEKQLEQA